MAKSNTNGNGADVTNGCAITPTIHLVLQREMWRGFPREDV